MEITVKKAQSNFEPIIVDVQFKITSYEELKEFMEYANQNGDVYQYDGSSSDTLNNLMISSCVESSTAPTIPIPALLIRTSIFFSVFKISDTAF